MIEPEGSEEQAASEGSSEKKVDESWKEEARKAKEVAEESDEQTRRPGPLPKPDFSFLVTSFAMQVMMHFGDFPNPVSGKESADLEQAKHGIDTLGLLEEKTKGNLTEQESKLLQTTLYDLRLRYVAISASGAPPPPAES